jgi:hypothetical protein
MRKVILAIILFSSSLLAQAAASTVTVSWNAVTTGGVITSFTILRSTSLTGTFTALSISAVYTSGTTEYSITDSTVIAGNTYYYEIEAVGPGGTSAPTPPSTAAIIIAVPATPSTPTVVVNP